MSAYDALERLAAGLVSKSDGTLTPEAAMVEVLKTDRGRQLYARDRAEQAAALVDAGLDPYRPLAEDSTAVRKAMSAADSIDELARKLQEQHPDWTLEQCTRKVLETPEGRDLYAAHENARRGGSVRHPSRAIEAPTDSRGQVRKDGGPVQLSKAAQDFLDDFTRWLDGQRVAKADVGGRVAATPVAKSADELWDELEALAAGVIEKRHGAVGFDSAVDIVIQTPEGRRLYQEYVSAQQRERGGGA